ncbi:hypothetical protein AD998_21430 [bacterium 336/3]|nr:hypothetical protein AD998_21430 [bacterium 336/3]
MKKYILLIVLVFCVNMGFAQRYRAESIEEGLQKGPDKAISLTIKYSNKYIPDISKLSLFTNIEELTIQSASDFPIEIVKLPNLQELILEDSKKTYALPKEIAKLTKLHYLKIDSVSSISEELFEITSMKTLHLSGNFNKISKSIGKLTILESLYLESKKGFILPSEIQNLQKLQYFNLKNPDALFTKSIYRLSNLWTLNFKSKKPQNISDSLSYLKNLINLRIDAPIKSLPNKIGDLSLLTHLTLLNCSINDLPASMQKLSRLQELFIVNSSLPKMPSIIFLIPRLENIMLDGNQIEKIEEDWNKLLSLKSFSASNNPIKFLPAHLPPKLGSLSLSNTLITTLPYNWHSGKRTQYFLDYIEAYNAPISQEEQTKIKETTHIKVLLGKKELIYDYNR